MMPKIRWPNNRQFPYAGANTPPPKAAKNVPFCGLGTLPRKTGVIGRIRRLDVVGRFLVRTFVAVGPVHCTRTVFVAKLGRIAFTPVDGREPHGKP
jgi:hypothetical protein